MEERISSIAREMLSNNLEISVLDIGPGYKDYFRSIPSGQIKRDIVEYDSDIIKWQVGIGCKNVFNWNLNNLDQCYLDQTYDLIILIEVLEHVENPGYVLSWLLKRLKTNGKIVITVPTRYSEKLMFCLNSDYNKYTLFPHVNFFNKAMLKNAVRFSGGQILAFKTINFGYLVYHSLLHSCHFNHNVSDGRIEGRVVHILHDVIVNGISRLARLFNCKSSIIGRNYFLILTSSQNNG